MFKALFLAASLLAVTTPALANPCSPCAVEQMPQDISSSALYVSGALRWKTKMFLQPDGSLTVRTGRETVCDQCGRPIQQWRWNSIPAGSWYWSEGAICARAFNFSGHSGV